MIKNSFTRRRKRKLGEGRKWLSIELKSTVTSFEKRKDLRGSGENQKVISISSQSEKDTVEPGCQMCAEICGKQADRIAKLAVVSLVRKKNPS